MNWKEIRERFKSHCLLKGIGSTVAISAFFVCYFMILQNPVLPVRMVPVLRLDEWIPVLPWSVWIYFSLWVYICLPQSLMREVRPMGHYLSGSVLLAMLGLLIFLGYPTAVPDWDIDWSSYSFIAFLKETDASGNALPSLHVAFALFSGLWLAGLLKRLGAHPVWHWGNGIWCAAIVASTMTTKQHVLWDVLSGALLGSVVFVANRWWLTRSQVKI